MSQGSITGSNAVPTPVVLPSAVGLSSEIRPFGQNVAARTEWDSPMFRLAQQQFLKAARIMQLDENVCDRLLFPQRTLIVSFACRRDDSVDVETVRGQRVDRCCPPGRQGALIVFGANGDFVKETRCE
ncbi:MAG: hypothetical protein O3C40_23535 [Planctomycetota bacterium]|nr:hypothetical protein [Planctomycetota bacterium]